MYLTDDDGEPIMWKGDFDPFLINPIPAKCDFYGDLLDVEVSHAFKTGDGI